MGDDFVVFVFFCVSGCIFSLVCYYFLISSRAVKKIHPRHDLLLDECDVRPYELTKQPVSYTHLTLPTNREV